VGCGFTPAEVFNTYSVMEMIWIGRRRDRWTLYFDFYSLSDKPIILIIDDADKFGGDGVIALFLTCISL
jgi:hypothetical protein